MQIYVGMGLTQAPKEFREDFQHELKALLRAIDGVEILDFVGLEAGTAADVYDHDCHCTRTADLCIFVVDHPSIGLGMEIMLRQSIGKPMFIFARENASVTRMLKGMCERSGISIRTYTTAADIARSVDMQVWIKQEFDS